MGLGAFVGPDNYVRLLTDSDWAPRFWGALRNNVVFFAIHIGRMNVTWNLVGMASPLVAVLGDVATSLLIAFGFILPYRLFWRRMMLRGNLPRFPSLPVVAAFVRPRRTPCSGLHTKT